MPTPSSNPPPELPPRGHSSSCPDELRASRRPEQDGIEEMSIDAVENSHTPVNAPDPTATIEHDVEADSRSNTESPRPSSRGEDSTNTSRTSSEDIVDSSSHPSRKPVDSNAGASSSRREHIAEGSESAVLSSTSPVSAFDVTSPVSTEGEKMDDVRLTSRIDQEDDPAPSMGYNFTNTRITPTSSSSFLRPGSKFHGTQQSERQIYDVQVEIKYVDLRESFLCGYLKIQGLTEDNPTLTTYFEGEIIGSKYGFITKHDSWGATEKVDLNHWNKFTAFRPIAKQNNIKKSDIRPSGPFGPTPSAAPAGGVPAAASAAASSAGTSGSSGTASPPGYSGGQIRISGDFAQKDNLFMRWKERFLVPDHKVRTINGASFEGFYYICFNQVKGTVSGIYFHSKSEKFQQLELKHVEDRGCFGAVEFR